jgi:hypothetical protein
MILGRALLLTGTMLANVLFGAAQCHIDSAQLYVDALFAKTQEAAAAIPLKDDVVRFECVVADNSFLGFPLTD